MVTITFEDYDGHRFAHIWSDNGVLGNAAEIKRRVPSGTWLTLPPATHRLKDWLVKKCGFRFISAETQDNEVLLLLLKE